MTQQAAIALGVGSGCSPTPRSTPPRSSPPTRPSATTATSTTSPRSPRAATSSPSTTSTCRSSTPRSSRRPGRWCTRAPHALPYVQDKIRMRRRLDALDMPVPPLRQVASVADVEDFARAHGWPVVGEGGVRRIRRQGRLAARPSDDARSLLARTERAVRRGERRVHQRSWPRSSRARRPGSRRPGRSSRPCNATASASRSWPPRRRSTPRRRRSRPTAGAAPRRRAGRRRVARRGAVRHADGRDGQRVGDAAAQLRPLDASTAR